MSERAWRSLTFQRRIHCGSKSWMFLVFRAPRPQDFVPGNTSTTCPLDFTLQSRIRWSACFLKEWSSLVQHPFTQIFIVFCIWSDHSYSPYFNGLSLKSARLKFTCKSSFFFWVVFFQMNSEKGYTLLLKSSLGLLFSSFMIMQTVVLDF